MKAQDLRCNNYINLTKDNFKTVKVYQLDAYDIYKLSETDCIDINPIPLTEEWLLKFGFGKESDTLFCKGYADLSYCLEYSKSFNDGRYFAGIRYDDWDADNKSIFQFTYKIQHVHQLQNLYHALTGEELTV